MRVQARTTAGRPSNAVPVAIHAPGRPCRDAVDWFCESVEHATRAPFVVLARVDLDLRLVPRDPRYFVNLTTSVIFTDVKQRTRSDFVTEPPAGKTALRRSSSVSGNIVSHPGPHAARIVG